MNYFSIFELPESLVVDTAQLRKKFLLLSRQYHPDFFDAAKGISAEENLKQAAIINEGFKVLQNNQSRIEHLLQLKGIITPHEKHQLDPDFLMEMMEINENWNETDSPQLIQNLETELGKSIDALYTKNIETFSRSDWELLKNFYFKRKYIRRLTDRSEGKQAEL
jgi:molecular chaperone HscB